MTSLRDQHDFWRKEAEAKQAKAENPCIRWFGPGPAGVTCGKCRFLEARRFSRVYWKCAQRQETRGAKTDHRVGWPACAKFEPPRSET